MLTIPSHKLSFKATRMAATKFIRNSLFSTVKKLTAGEFHCCFKVLNYKDFFRCAGAKVLYALAAYEFAIASGIMEESSYPYLGKPAKCPRSYTPSYYLNNFAYVNFQGDEEKLKMALLKHGPVVVTLGELNAS